METPVPSAGKTVPGKNNPIYDSTKIPAICIVFKISNKTGERENCTLNKGILTSTTHRYYFPWEYVCPHIQ